MSGRFAHVTRWRFGVLRDCIQDVDTGLIAVFVTDAADVAARCAALNAGASPTSRYIWQEDREDNPND